MSLFAHPMWPEGPPLSAELGFLNNPISHYFNADPPYNNPRLYVMVLTQPPELPRILLVQASATSDPHAFSTVWEAHSDFPQPTDESLHHTLARIVTDQTGLQLCPVLNLSGSETTSEPQRDGNLP